MNSKTKILSTKTINPNFDTNRFEFIQHDFIQTKDINFEINEWHDLNIFTSQNAVNSVLKNNNIQSIKSKHCLCVGQKTKDLLLSNDFEVLATTAYAEDLTDIIEENYLSKSFNFFCGNLSLPTLPTFFKKKDIIFAKVLVYETIKTPKKINQSFEAIMFFSPSAVESFLDQNQITNEICFCIGQTTAKALQHINDKQIIVSKNQTIEGVLETLNKFYS